MIYDIGEFTPNAGVGPTFDPMTGVTSSGFTPNNVDQLKDVRPYLENTAIVKGVDEVSCLIHWAFEEPTIIYHKRGTYEFTETALDGGPGPDRSTKAWIAQTGLIDNGKVPRLVSAWTRDQEKAAEAEAKALADEAYAIQHGKAPTSLAPLDDNEDDYEEDE